VLVGVAHDMTGSWTAGVALLLFILVPQTAFGVAAGRRMLLGAG
jgi:cyanate permease